MEKSRDPFAPTFRSNPVDYLLDHPSLVLTVLAVGLTSLFAGYKIYGNHERTVAQAEFDHQAQVDAVAAQHMRDLANTFAIQPLPPTPKLGVAPVLPPLPAEQHDRMRYLVQQNPIAEIHDEMNALVEQGDLLVNMQTQAGLSGAFVYEPVQFIAYTSKPLPPGTTAWPVYSMNPSELSSMTQADVLREMVIVYHEFQHFKQWRAADLAKRNYWLPKLVGSAISQDQCSNVWQGELEAYSRECVVALSWGVTDSTGDLCLRSEDEVDFKRTLFIMLGSGTSGQNMPECLATWAQLAGHPHPEAYQ